MKKYSFLVIAPVIVILAVVSFGVSTVVQAQNQNDACPTNLVCTHNQPIAVVENPHEVCPTGFVCTPNQPVAVIENPPLSNNSPTVVPINHPQCSDNYPVTNKCYGSGDSSVSVSAVVVDASSDKVGSGFGQSVGIGNSNPADYHISATVNSSLQRQIKNINIRHFGDTWSTDNNWYYPIQIFKGNSAVNSTYLQALDLMVNGTLNLDFYVQPELTPFRGGTITVNFTDGTTAKGSIPASSVEQANISCATSDYRCSNSYVITYPKIPATISPTVPPTTEQEPPSCPTGYICSTLPISVPLPNPVSVVLPVVNPIPLQSTNPKSQPIDQISNLENLIKTAIADYLKNIHQ